MSRRNMLITNSSRTAGMVYLQYRFQEMGWPSWAARVTPATLAEAPMGVAMPPKSVP